MFNSLAGRGNGRAREKARLPFVVVTSQVPASLRFGGANVDLRKACVNGCQPEGSLAFSRAHPLPLPASELNKKAPGTFDLPLAPFN